MDDESTIFPAPKSLTDVVAALRAMPKPPTSEIRDPIEMRDDGSVAGLIFENWIVHS
jgi:hypothetical protein